MRERWWVDAADRAAVEAIAPLDLVAWIDRARGGRELSGDRQSVAARIDTAGGPWFVKWRHTLPSRRWKTWGRPSRERAERDAAARAIERGVPALRIVAAAERRRAGRVIASLLARPFDDGARGVPDLLSARPDRVEDASRALAAWHATGFRHGDAWPKNVLAWEDGARFAPIGHPHARFAPPSRTRWDAMRARDLARFLTGLESLGLAERALAAYAAASGIEADRIRRSVTPLRARILLRKRERERTRAAREPRGPPRPSPPR